MISRRMQQLEPIEGDSESCGTSRCNYMRTGKGGFRIGKSKGILVERPWCLTRAWRVHPRREGGRWTSSSREKRCPNRKGVFFDPENFNKATNVVPFEIDLILSLFLSLRSLSSFIDIYIYILVVNSDRATFQKFSTSLDVDSRIKSS